MLKTAPTTGWSRLNVFLHWTIVLLIIGQWIEGGFMSDVWDATLDGKITDQLTTTLGYSHIVIGSVILAATLIRLGDRFVVGRPPHNDEEPQWSTMLAKVTHFLLYALLIVMPVLGLLAWFTGNDTIAGYHAFLWTPLLVLAGLHILGALAQHFWFRSPALKRMIPGVRHSV
ncbi:cytochrome b/b6 domain-containing protein [Jiella sp. MQZ9-1]|uniref:Cytochrome b/b6 domain-containing protein n=1 Tax=Jiella flava TaxID=2816857 RepID=A0A939FXS3_9HYPH|nr:cytochrome b/b6 domain-containing protein [Jiella flava]MBO0663465.1 cytochrome b/b6 domain-containing protein [Jiella flava]MCD2472040.1 cytochrome b/b6 domain-containing protein [Jiella flava]